MRKLVIICALLSTFAFAQQQKCPGGGEGAKCGSQTSQSSSIGPFQLGDEILVDKEILTVGSIEFYKKCFFIIKDEKMRKKCKEAEVVGASTQPDHQHKCPNGKKGEKCRSRYKELICEYSVAKEQVQCSDGHIYVRNAKIVDSTAREIIKEVEDQAEAGQEANQEVEQE